MSAFANPRDKRAGATTGMVLAGRFRLDRFLAMGGMGEVWAAQQLALDRPVAIKFLTADAAAKAESVARFEVEAKALSKVDHEQVLRILDFGHDAELGFFLVTELLEGDLLSELFQREGALGAERAARILAQILAGLAAAHHVGIVHRDLKPENVMLVERAGRRDFVKILDFGIAKLIEEQRRVDLTEIGTAVGTPAYLAPEQALGKAVDPRTDIYACGILLYRALAGRHPFDARTPAALAVKHITEAAPRLPDDLVPEALADVVARAVEKAPDARFPDALAMRKALIASVGLAEEGHGGLRAVPSGPAGPADSNITSMMPVVAPPDLALPEAAKGAGVRASAAVLALRMDWRGEQPRSGSDTLPMPGVSLVDPQQDPGRGMRLAGVLVREAIAAFGGFVARPGGADGPLIATFSRSADAIACAAAIHDRLRQDPVAITRMTEARAAIISADLPAGSRDVPGDVLERIQKICREAPPGGVVFGKDLLGALGPYRAELHASQDPGTRQRLQRLLPPGSPPQPRLPFGGASLERIEQHWSRKVERGVDRGAAAVRAWLDRAVAKAGELAAKARAQAQKNPSAAIGVAAGAGVLGLVALVGLSALLLPGDPEEQIEAALASGEHAEAREAAEALREDRPDDPRTGLLMARALAAGGDHVRALLELRGAFEKDAALAADPAFGRALADCLDRDDAGAAQALVTLVGDRVAPALLDATRSPSTAKRRNAVKALEGLGAADRIDRTEVSVLELKHATECDHRVKAARTLGQSGDDRVVPVLVDARLGIDAGREPCDRLGPAIDAALGQLRRKP